MKFDYAALERRIAALEANRGASLRFGKVVGVTGGAARVQLADGQDMVSAPLPTLQRRVLKDQEIKLPDDGEPVACLFAGQGMEAGVVLGAVYSKATPDPEQERQVEFSRFTPRIRASMDSSLLVTSISTTRDEVPGMLKPTVKPGRLRDGFSLTGSSGINATPTKARQTNATMTVKEETRFIS